MKKSLLQKSIRAGYSATYLVIFQYAITFGTQVFFARLLSPAVFGVFAFVSLVTFFFAKIANIHVEKYVIVQKGDIKTKLNTAFTFELVLAAVLMLILIALSPTLMGFFGKPEQSVYVAFLALTILYTPLTRPKSLFEKELKFLSANLPLLFSMVVGGAIGVALAFYGYGIWSLLVWRIVTYAIEIAIIWSIVPYRPRFQLKREHLVSLLLFGLPLTAGGTLAYVYGSLDFYIVDRVLGPEQFGYYWLAFQMSHYALVGRELVNRVVLPTLSKVDNLQEREDIFEFVSNATGFLLVIASSIITFYGEQIVYVVFGEKWLPATVPMQIFFVVVVFKTIGGASSPFLHAHSITKADIHVAVVNLLAIAPAVYFGATFYGIEGAAVGLLIVGILSVFYVYTRYIKPLTKKNVIFYFWRPSIILFTSLLFVMVYKMNWYLGWYGYNTGFVLTLLMCTILYKNTLISILTPLWIKIAKGNSS